MIKSKLQNTTILDNTGTRVQPNVIVGEYNGYASGDILDANAVTLLIKGDASKEADNTHNGKTPSEVLFYKESSDGVKFIVTVDGDRNIHYFYGSSGFFLATSDPDEYELHEESFSNSSEGTQNLYDAYSYIQPGSSHDPINTVYIGMQTDANALLVPEEGKYISNIDGDPTYVAVANDSDDFTATIRVMTQSEFEALSDPKGITFVINDVA